MFDKDIGYCQGMNIITSWLLKFLRQTKVSEDGTKTLVYDEVSAFYCLIHIMKNHGWREVFDDELSKLQEHLSFLEEVLSTAFTDIHKHLLNECCIDLVPVFASLITTIFISDL